MEILEKLKTALPNSAGRFKMVTGSGHTYVVYTGDKEQLIIDPTIAQFTKKKPEVFVGPRKDLEYVLTRSQASDRIGDYFDYGDKGLSKTAGRRKTRRRSNTAKTICMKKSVYLREHHHLFKVLRKHTRRALKAELRAQTRELKERGLKG